MRGAQFFLSDKNCTAKDGGESHEIIAEPSVTENMDSEMETTTSEISQSDNIHAEIVFEIANTSKDQESDEGTHQIWTILCNTFQYWNIFSVLDRESTLNELLH